MPEKEDKLKCSDCGQPFSGQFAYETVRGKEFVAMQGELMRQLAEHHYHNSSFSGCRSLTWTSPEGITQLVVITRQDVNATPRDLSKWKFVIIGCV